MCGNTSESMKCLTTPSTITALFQSAASPAPGLLAHKNMNELDVGGGKILSIKSVVSITDPINNRFK